MIGKDIFIFTRMSFLEVSLITIYTIAFSIVILKTKLFHSQYVSKPFLVGVFLLKIMIGFLYAYIHFDNGWRDTFVFFLDAKKISQLFFDNPDLYFQFFLGKVDKPFSPEIEEIMGVSTLEKYGIRRSSFFVKINMLLMPLSLGSYVVQCVLYECLSILGIFWVYDFFTKRIEYNNNLLKLFLFLSPSLLFWLSGLHKDGLTILGFGVLLFSADKMLNKKWLYILFFLVGCYFSFSLRDYAFLLFLPALIAYIIAVKTKTLFRPFIVIYTVGVLLFFFGKNISPLLDFPRFFVTYQSEFISLLKGNSDFDVILLEETPQSFIAAAPQALYNVLFRPNFFDAKTAWMNIAAIETTIYTVLSLLALLFFNIKRLTKIQKALILFLFAYGVTYSVMMGLVVDNLGALFRYKVISVFFIGSLLLLLLDYEKMIKIFHIKKTLKSIKDVN